MCQLGSWSPRFVFTRVIFILPILKGKRKRVTTKSYSHNFYFKGWTVIKDNKSGNCLTGSGPTLCLGGLSKHGPKKYQSVMKAGRRNFSWLGAWLPLSATLEVIKNILQNIMHHIISTRSKTKSACKLHFACGIYPDSWVQEVQCPQPSFAFWGCQ